MSHYLISEASRLVDEESHVLRYWEEELALKIPRNDLGHRYYTEVQLETFRTIKDLKQRGYQLKEIRQYLEEMESGKEPEENPPEEIRPEEDAASVSPEKDGGENAWTDPAEPSGEAPEKAGKESPHPALVVAGSGTAAVNRQARLQEFRELMTGILTDAMEAGLEQMSSRIGDQVSVRVIKELNYLDREREEREEKRFRDLDEAIRSRQRKGRVRAEAAAAMTEPDGRKSWGKRRRAGGQYR